jgi:tRNA(fMet)-specific endonuclease VapC
MESLIDTSIIVEAERKRLNLQDHVAGREEGCYLSVVTMSELWHGLHRATTVPLATRRKDFIDKLSEQFAIVPIDLEVALEHSRVWAHLSIKGQMIGMNDLWIAATCLAFGMSIVTANVRDFERVPDLQIEVWKS